MARILACDDDPGIRDLLAVTLDLDHEVRLAVHGRDALEQLHDDPDVDLVVLDVMMPELDGFETLQRLRTTPPFEDVVVIMLSARVAEHDYERAFAAGADEYLTKPFDPDELESAVARLLDASVEERRRIRGEDPAARVAARFGAR